MSKRKRLKRRFLAVSVIALSILVASPALAANDTQSSAKYQAKYFFGRHQGGQAYAKPSVIGKVAAIAGESITVTDQNGVNYSVDATGAQVRKGFNQAANISTVAVGDTVLVQGTLAGSVVTASKIIDRKLADEVVNGSGSTTPRSSHKFSSSSVEHINNGQTRITGTLQSIYGNSLTVLSLKGLTYTVDASASKIVLGGGARNNNIASGTVASLQVNDSLMISGIISTTSSTTLTAKMIRDTSRTL